jgi:hypothetical protein
MTMARRSSLVRQLMPILASCALAGSSPGCGAGQGGGGGPVLKDPPPLAAEETTEAWMKQQGKAKVKVKPGKRVRPPRR